MRKINIITCLCFMIASQASMAYKVTLDDHSFETPIGPVKLNLEPNTTKSVIINELDINTHYTIEISGLVEVSAELLQISMRLEKSKVISSLAKIPGILTVEDVAEGAMSTMRFHTAKDCPVTVITFFIKSLNSSDSVNAFFSITEESLESATEEASAATTTTTAELESARCATE